MSTQHYANFKGDWQWAHDPILPWLTMCCRSLVLFETFVIAWACALLPFLVLLVVASFLLCFAGSSDPNVQLYDGRIYWFGVRRGKSCYQAGLGVSVV
ncbi:hypothetical protein PG985_005127 [Apiospora marii]|uniref:Uncharacterized protein n=1 Tax=Apiospora marii TaxID=335849 RepID=A0ABR1SB21_9PEZI